MQSAEKAKAALKDIISAFSLPDNVTRLNEAKDNAGNDMLMYMQLVFPLATQIQQEVIQSYGFPADREGLLQFMLTVKMLEKDDQEVLQMNADLRSLLLPPVVLPFSQSSAV
ncbi:protein C10-like isoform X2 [Stegodyphus dumicola]|uniref:protein C10-like isoform X2 n=1 Tax=Stegodyphus dumicola TaxID=202533 RepID=UPI0015B09E61|nr:protein C10-like isoform X2 [Stegodyphus dumicola]